jgi:hypothetical protein
MSDMHLNHIRTAITDVLKARTLEAMRDAVLHLSCALDPKPEHAPDTIDQAAPTLRSAAPDFECAPSVPADAAEIAEYDRAQATPRPVAMPDSSGVRWGVV